MGKYRDNYHKKGKKSDVFFLFLNMINAKWLRFNNAKRFFVKTNIVIFHII